MIVRNWNTRMWRGIAAANLLLAGAVVTSAGLAAAESATTTSHYDWNVRLYDVTVTNLTPGQSFTPILVASHRASISLFSAGAPASAELATLAEGGDTAPLAALLAGSGQSFDIQTTAGLLAPGQSVTVRLKTRGHFDRISLASMLIPTNDSFIAINGVERPDGRAAMTLDMPAYDAGSEPNDELCANIPGPVCGGAGGSPAAGGEGFVHVSRGIHGVGDLSAAQYDWRNPAVRVQIVRVRGN